jgi:hypothetical protein
MSLRIVRTGLVAIFIFACLGAGASAGMSASGVKDETLAPNQEQGPTIRPLKLKGAGQIDVSTFAIEFSGVATHLGKYTAIGMVDPNTLQIQGTLTAADGDTLDWVAQFQFGPLGEIVAAFTITGGTGRFTGASGSAAGPVVLDPDFMFTLNLEGRIAY